MVRPIQVPCHRMECILRDFLYRAAFQREFGEDEGYFPPVQRHQNLLLASCPDYCVMPSLTYESYARSVIPYIQGNLLRSLFSDITRYISSDSQGRTSLRSHRAESTPCVRTFFRCVLSLVGVLVYLIIPFRPSVDGYPMLQFEFGSSLMISYAFFISPAR